MKIPWVLVEIGFDFCENFPKFFENPDKSPALAISIILSTTFSIPIFMLLHPVGENWGHKSVSLGDIPLEQMLQHLGGGALLQEQNYTIQACSLSQKIVVGIPAWWGVGLRWELLSERSASAWGPMATRTPGEGHGQTIAVDKNLLENNADFKGTSRTLMLNSSVFNWKLALNQASACKVSSTELTCLH